MRSEQAMYALILDTARADDRIRAVLLNGSRANPHVRRDCFQDFDIIYFVHKIETFRNNLAWLDRFGERMIMQIPEAMSATEEQDPCSRFTCLMQFCDGNRIDLTFYPIEQLHQFSPDSLSILLLDKDNLLPPLPPPSEQDYLPQPPTAHTFANSCNEFWWVCPYAAKGLWRAQLPYAKAIIEQVLRPQLLQILVWQTGIQTNFSCNPGIFGKYLPDLLTEPLWAHLQQTYADAEEENNWHALLTMSDLFHECALAVAEHFKLPYPAAEAQRVRAALHHIHTLPRDAQKIF